MKKILIVDDETLILYSLSKTLFDQDREIVTASTGKDALREIHDRAYDLCLLDLHLPDMSGLDIMKTLREVSPNTKIMIITGSMITESMMQSIQENAHLLITKPFDLDEVMTFADQLLTQTGPASGTLLKDGEPLIQGFLRQIVAGEDRKPRCLRLASPDLAR
ncbi:MAG TPA: response regulator [Nitrospirota bacterium]